MNPPCDGKIWQKCVLLQCCIVYGGIYRIFLVKAEDWRLKTGKLSALCNFQHSMRKKLNFQHENLLKAFSGNQTSFFFFFICQWHPYIYNLIEIFHMLVCISISNIINLYHRHRCRIDIKTVFTNCSESIIFAYSESLDLIQPIFVLFFFPTTGFSFICATSCT